MGFCLPTLLFGCKKITRVSIWRHLERLTKIRFFLKTQPNLKNTIIWVIYTPQHYRQPYNQK